MLLCLRDYKEDNIHNCVIKILNGYNNLYDLVL